MMEKKEYCFEDFLLDVHPAYHEFVQQTHEMLQQRGYKMKIEMAKSGFLVSYFGKKTKRSIANFVFRKSGLVVRIYGECVNQYLDFMETLPDSMIKAIDKAPICKRLVNPTACNGRCPMGYDFMLKEKHQQKCRYNGFMFPVNDEHVSFIKTFLEREAEERSKAC
ncbi:MAG: hypothetical protein FWD25_05425 [Clostridia bacterium]|nr:hypothetical protein [Clostridia bacterium]